MLKEISTLPTTYINVEELLPLRSNVEHDAVDWSGQGDSTDEKSDEDDVGENGREVGHLTRARHALPEREEQQDVARSQATDQTEYCCQFHQQFTSTFCAEFHLAKNYIPKL